MNKLEKQVLRIIGDDPDDPDVFKDDPVSLAPIRDSINDAVEELAMASGGHVQTFHVPLVAGKLMYRLRFARGHWCYVQSAWLTGQKRRLDQTTLGRLNSQDPRWMVSSATPRSYFQVGTDLVGFAFKPSASSDVVELTSVVIPARYENDTETVRVRDAFKFAVVNYAVAEYWASRGDAVAATKDFAQYMGRLEAGKTHEMSNDRFLGLSTRKSVDTDTALATEP
mgnify:CR=1 FL=1|tara:strand:- start:322 stop:996 length:675 start_codon:yes stop_codon:yes gene_type:complete